MSEVDELRKSLEIAHREERFQLDRADEWKRIAQDQAKRIRELEGTLDASRAALRHSSDAIESMGKRIYELETALETCPGCGAKLQQLSEKERIVHAQLCDWSQ